MTLSAQVHNCVVLGQYELNVKLTDRRTRGDCDNRLKAVNDLLQSMWIVVDDKLCIRASVERGDTEKHDCILTVTGEIAYNDQWEFAAWRAKKKLGRR